ncbi:Putative pentatricopeptide repeat-containing protein At3g11460, mitochondrial [Linum perenne]
MNYAQTLFDRLCQKDVFVWNTLIRGYANLGPCQKAVALYRSMHSSGLLPDNYTFPFVIRSCAGIKVGVDSDTLLINSLIALYGKCGHVDTARALFDGMVVKNLVSWNAMIAAYEHHGRAIEALNLFAKMKEEGTKPNGFTFTAVLTACRHVGLVDEGKKHFESMFKDYSIVPGIEQCACMVDLLGRAGCLIEAYKFIESMPIHADASVWGALLGACRIYDNFELAELVAEKMIKLDPQDVTPYVIMSHIYSIAGRSEDVSRLRNLMRKREVKKLPGYSLVEANRRLHRFLVDSKPRPSWPAV